MQSLFKLFCKQTELFIGIFQSRHNGVHGLFNIAERWMRKETVAGGWK
jgi:hypothetical protein